MQTLIMSLRSNLQGIGFTRPDLGARSRQRPLRAWPILSALLIVVVASVVLTLGPSHIMAPWDVFILLDGAWRIFDGQVPHTDFHNPVGPLVYWLTAVGMHIGEPSLTGYIYGNVIFLVVVASWGAFVFFRKLPPFFAVLLTLFITALIVAARPLGYDPATTTYAMIYNRYGWALLSILFIQLFVADQTASPSSATFDSISAGLLLALIFFCKMNFFLVAIVAVALAVFLRPELRGRVALVATGFSLVCFGAWLTVGTNPLHYLQDVAFAAKSQSLGHRTWALMKSLHSNLAQGLMLGGIWLYLIALPTTRRQAPWSYGIDATLIFGFVVASALLITIGNSAESGDIPLFLIAGVILLETWRRVQPTSVSALRLLGAPEYGLSTLMVVVILFGSVFAKDIFSLAQSRFYLVSDAPLSQRFDAPHLRDFVIPHTSDWQTAYSRARQVPARINEGLTILRRHVSPQRRLAVLALTDPFSFALGLKPPRGTPLWWDLNVSFARNNYPRAAVIFSDADFVIYPILRSQNDGCCQETVVALRELYHEYLRQHYVEVDRSEHWGLLKRRDWVSLEGMDMSLGSAASPCTEQLAAQCGKARSGPGR